MCFGPELIAIAGAAASGVGSIMQQNEAQADAARRTRARNEELRQNLARQQQHERDARLMFDQRRDDMAEPQQQEQLSEAQDKRTDLLVDQIKPSDTAGVPLSGSAPNVVQSELAKRMQSAMEDSKGKAAALGKLGGFDQQWFNNGMANNALGRGIGTINNFSRSEAGMLPGLQDLAELSVAKPPSGIGSILQGVGNLAGAAAGGGTGKSWF